VVVHHLHVIVSILYSADQALEPYEQGQLLSHDGICGEEKRRGCVLLLVRGEACGLDLNRLSCRDPSLGLFSSNV